MLNPVLVHALVAHTKNASLANIAGASALGGALGGLGGGAIAHGASSGADKKTRKRAVLRGAARGAGLGALGFGGGAALMSGSAAAGARAARPHQKAYSKARAHAKSLGHDPQQADKAWRAANAHSHKVDRIRDDYRMAGNAASTLGVGVGTPTAMSHVARKAKEESKA